MADQLSLQSFVREELRDPRHADPRRLVRFGRKVFSQGDEDGIISEIFRRIGTTTRRFIEIGVYEGVECNTAWLLHLGWGGVWIDADSRALAVARSNTAQFHATGQLATIQRYIDIQNANQSIEEIHGSTECDLLSIDIDYNDYWVWQAITNIKPRVVVIEYNARWAPPAEITVEYDTTRSWVGHCHFGASLAALHRLSETKGYSLVACTMSGVNAFFVRDDLLADHFLAPGVFDEHYEPARYFLIQLEPGHPAAFGPFVNLAAEQVLGGSSVDKPKASDI